MGRWKRKRDVGPKTDSDPAQEIGHGDEGAPSVLKGDTTKPPVLPFHQLKGWQQQQGSDEDPVLTVECSVVTGMEPAAQKEAARKLSMAEESIYPVQGRILFDVPREKLAEVLQLRTVDNVWIMMGAWKDLQEAEGEDKKKAIQHLIELMQQLPWKRSLEAWSRVRGFEGNLYPNDEQLTPTAAAAGAVASFRCTCYRSGDSHAYSSMDAAKEVGGAINDLFGWKVQMKHSDLDVVLTIDGRQVHFGLALNRESLFNRNIEHFGPTTLRATICSALLQYADIQAGDVVVDPLCGGGSIPIEGADAFRSAFHLGGDLHEKAFARAGDNVKSLQSKTNESLPIDIARWNATNIPLRPGCVDVLVSDLPFGKRSGSKADNRVLYPKILISMAQAVRPKTGRAILLTQDKSSMFKCFSKIAPFWKVNRYSYANIGGLAALVFFMKRTDKIPES